MLTLGAVIVGLIAALAFVIRYQYEVGFSWWRHADGTENSFGRFLMIRKLLLAALFAIVLLNRTVPGWTGQRMVTALLMVAFAVQTFVPYRLLLSAQRAHEEVRQDMDPNATGEKKLFRDSKIGNLVNGAVGAAVLYLAQAAGDFDVTPLPDALEPLAVVALATAAGLLTSWATARRKVPA
jgi:hypothetical protein